MLDSKTVVFRSILKVGIEPARNQGRCAALSIAFSEKSSTLIENRSFHGNS